MFVFLAKIFNLYPTIKTVKLKTINAAAIIAAFTDPPPSLPVGSMLAILDRNQAIGSTHHEQNVGSYWLYRKV